MCSAKVSKVILVILNIVFVLLGLGLLVPGILVLIDESVINDEVLPALQSVTFGVSNLGDMAKGLSITLIVIGSFVVVISLMGCIGACCDVKCFLIIYIVIVALLLIGKLAIVIMWIAFNSDIQSKLKDELKKGLAKFEHDDLTTDEVSTGWNYLNMNFKCCGIESMGDYTSTAWVKTTNNAGKVVPISCCKGATSSPYAEPTGGTCPRTSSTGLNSDGCYDAIKSFATKYSIAFICVGVSIVLVEIAAIVFACILCKNSGKDNVV